MSDPTSAPAPTSEASTADSFWQVVRHALRGEHHDFTAVALNRAIILLAVPMVLEMVMESLFAVTDVFWVSRLGKEAVAVVGITESVMTLIYAVAIGVSIAATAIVARRIGEKNPEAAAHAGGQIILLGAVVAALLGLGLGGYAPQILRFMGADDAVASSGATFARIMLGGNITVFLIFVINAIFRGAGDVVLAMRTLWLANSINILLGPCLVFGLGPFPHLGLAGAGLATNIGRGIGVLYQLAHLIGRSGRIRLQLRHAVPERAVILSVLRMSASGAGQLLINTTSYIGLIRILAPFGSAALAGYTIAFRVFIFALLPAWGLANAGATLVGQNLGAKKPDRAEAAVRIATRYNMLFLGCLGLIFVTCATPLIRIFSSDPEVVSNGSRALWIMSLGFPIFAAGMCSTSAFNGAGDTRTPTLLNFVSFWLGELPLAWLLSSYFGLGPTGVYIAVPTAFTILAVWGEIIFRRGRWKRHWETLHPSEAVEGEPGAADNKREPVGISE